MLRGLMGLVARLSGIARLSGLLKLNRGSAIGAVVRLLRDGVATFWAKHLCHIVCFFTAQNYNFPVKYQTTWHIIYAQCAVAGLMLCHWLGDLLAVGGMPNESTMKWCPVIKLGMVRRNESTTCWCLFRN